MMGLHYDENVLIDYLISPDDVEQSEAIEEHLSTCSSCRSLTEDFAHFSQELSNPEVWEREELSSALARADESKADEFTSYAARLQEERYAANSHLSSLLQVEPPFRPAMIELSPELCNAGVVHELCERAYQILEQSPAESIELSKLAISISDRLPASSYATNTILHLRGRAWKEHGLALRWVSRYDDALGALDQAERYFSQATVSEFDLATVAYVRTEIFYDLGRLSEALLLVGNCARVFAQFGDQERYLRSRLIEGTIRYKSGDIRAARQTWTELLKPVQASRDLQTLGSLLHNLGNACLELGEADEAGSYMLQAISIFEELGLRSEAVRGRWAIGRLVAASGRLDDAQRRLRQVQEEFEKLEMLGDAGLAALDIVELLLRTEQSSEAAVICRYLVERFTRAGMSDNAVAALSYLREALAAGKATPKLATHVRTFLAELPDQRERLFAPPPLPL
jgi:tetratricopeptide (TPR) repeat protein